MKYLYTLLLMLVAYSFCNAQSVTIRGQVKNDKDLVIEGASVTVKNGRITVATDNKGRFQITVPSLPVTLKVSKVAYYSNERTINSSDSLQHMIFKLFPAPAPECDLPVKVKKRKQAG